MLRTSIKGKDSGLSLVNGVLKGNGVKVAEGTQLSGTTTSYDDAGKYVGSHWKVYEDPVRYVFSKMGYSLLKGETLNYVNAETRLGLSPSGVRQYAVREVAK